MPSSARTERRRAGRLGFWLGLAIALGAASPAGAQRPVTLEEAVAAAEVRSPDIAVARADSAAAAAELSTARLFPNPTLAYDYSKAVPHNHVILEQLIDYPGVLAARTRAARVALGAAALTMAAARTTVRYQVELAYWRAAGAAAVEALSRRNVENGRALLASVRARRDAGDASDLDVAMTEVTLGQVRSTLLTDSIEAVRATLELQSLMGLSPAQVEVRATDSLAALPPAELPLAATAAPARVAAAAQQLTAAQARVALAERSRFPAPSLRAGFEKGDPSEPGILPTFGITLPIPIFSRGGAEVAAARAAAARATAELAAVRRETELAHATAAREAELARARIEIDRATLAAAEKVAALSLTAYREGAYPLATVLEAQRSARDALRQYLTDLVAGRSAEAALALALGAGGATPP
jgi:cobalt-zinc-cadmium efflux system outer membrane protein